MCAFATVRAIVAVCALASATIDIALAQTLPTLQDLAGLTCTGGGQPQKGGALEFDKDGVTYHFPGRDPYRGVLQPPYKGMLTVKSPYGAITEFEKLDGNTLTGFSTAGGSWAPATWLCRR